MYVYLSQELGMFLCTFHFNAFSFFVKESVLILSCPRVQLPNASPRKITFIY
jgi:hypothetical protein